MTIAVNLGPTCEDQIEATAALQLKDVAGTNDIRRPERLVILFTIDPAELCGEVKDEVDRASALKELLELSVRPYVRPKHLRI